MDMGPVLVAPALLVAHAPQAQTPASHHWAPSACMRAPWIPSMMRTPKPNGSGARGGQPQPRPTVRSRIGLEAGGGKGAKDDPMACRNESRRGASGGHGGLQRVQCRLRAMCKGTRGWYGEGLGSGVIVKVGLKHVPLTPKAVPLLCWEKCVVARFCPVFTSYAKINQSWTIRCHRGVEKGGPKRAATPFKSIL